jgi:hypothetical protein
MVYELGQIRSTNLELEEFYKVGGQKRSTKLVKKGLQSCWSKKVYIKN